MIVFVQSVVCLLNFGSVCRWFKCSIVLQHVLFLFQC